MNATIPTVWRSALLLAFCILLIFSSVTMAQSGGSFELVWGVTTGGGGASAGGEFSLGGTAGQAAYGVATGGNYTVTSGVSGGGTPSLPMQYVFLPLVTEGQ